MSTTKSSSTEYKTYEFVLTLKLQQHPRKWIPDVINESLIGDEKLLDWDVIGQWEIDNEEDPCSW